MRVTVVDRTSQFVAGAAIATMMLILGDVAQAQPAADQPDTRPMFDAVSIKVTAERRGTPPAAPDRYYRSGARLQELLTDAFGYTAVRTVGVPDWGKSTMFEVAAKASGPMTAESQRLLLQRMLAERFGLRTHVESRDMDYFALTAANKDGQFGARLSQTKEDCAAIRADRARRGDVGLAIPRTPGAEKPVCGAFFYNISMPDGQRSIRFLTGGSTLTALADFLSGQALRPVIDRTGLTGDFDADLEFSILSGAAADNQPSLATAVEEQLGLKLEPRRGPLDVLVIDAVKIPTDN